MPVADQVALTATFSSIRRIRSCLLPPKNCPHGTTVDDDSDQSIRSHVKASSEREVNQIPNAGRLPITQSSPTAHPGPATHLLREYPECRCGARIQCQWGRRGQIKRGRPPCVLGTGAGRRGL